MAYATQMVASDNGSIFTAAKEVCSDVVGSVMNPMSLIMAPLQMQDPIMSGYIRNYSLQAGYTWEKPVLFNGKTLFEKNKENPWTGYKSVKTKAGQEVEQLENALKKAKKGSDKKAIEKAQKALDEAREANGLQSVKQQFKNFNLRETLARGTSFQRDAYRSFAKSFSDLASEEKIVEKIAGKYDLKLNKGADIKSVLDAVDKGDDALLKAAKTAVEDGKKAQKLADMARSVKMLGGKNYLTSKNPLDMLGNGYRKLIGDNKFLRKVPVISIVMNSIGQFPDIMTSAQYGAGEFGKQMIRSTAQVATNVIGFEVGGAVGAKLGAIIGTAICPVFGTAIGTVIGSIAGGTLFSSVGTKVVDWLSDKILGKQKWKQEQPQTAQNPFRQAA